MTAAPRISEFQPNPDGFDPSSQTIELVGAPGASFDGVIVSVESDAGGANPGDVNDVAAVSGVFDANGLLTASIGDLENPSFTLALLDGFTGSAGVDIDADDDGTADALSSFGTVLDAIGVPDAAGDAGLLYGAQLGGTDFAFTGAEPELVFRDRLTGELYAVNDLGGGGPAVAADGGTAAFAAFDADPATPTFGAANPALQDGGGNGGDGGATPEVVLNELRISAQGSDVARNFVELFGDAGAALDGLSIVVLSGEFEPGQVDFAFDLTGESTDADGFFLLRNDNDEFDFFGSPSTFLLVEDFDAAIGDDLDGDDDGTLDSAPWGAILDGVSLIDGDAEPDRSYADAVIGPDGSFPPAGAARNPNGSGGFVQLAFGSLASDTPGAENFPALAPAAATIMEIQGAGHVSPFVLAAGQSAAEFFDGLPADASSVTGEAVRTTGVVTAVDSNGFYLQDPAGDGDVATSDALFVFTGSAPGVSAGQSVAVEGVVAEFFPGGTDTRNLPLTQIVSPSVEALAEDLGPVAPTPLGADGRRLPAETIDDDAFAAFEPGTDGIDFFESVEAMLVTGRDLVAVSGTNRFGEIFAVADGGADATGLSARGTLNISPDDFNPEKIQIDEDPGVFNFDFPEVAVGAALGDVTGVVGYSFGNFEILPTQDFTAQIAPSALAPEVTALTTGGDTLTLASYNVLNLDPVAEDPANTDQTDGDFGDDVDDDVGDGRFAAIAQQIVANLGSPDIIGLQEIQNNDGSEISDVAEADETLRTLVEAISAAGGPDYAFIDTPGVPTTRVEEGELIRPVGGQPGGDIRNAFLFNPERVALKPGSVETILDDDGDALPFLGGRIPLVATFTFEGEEVTVVNNHFSSKGGSAPILGVEQDFAARQEDPSVNGSLDERQAQSAAVRDHIAAILADDPLAKVAAIGDFNEFEFVSPVAAFEEEPLSFVNLTDKLPPDERYSFIFQGNSQALDHIAVSPELYAVFEGYDAVSVNAEFAATPDRASDHEPVLAAFDFGAPAEPEPFTLQLLHLADQEPLQAGGGLTDIVNASALFAQFESELPTQTLKLSSGDAIIPGTFYSASEAAFGAGGIGDIQIQNELGFVAITLGNHEFDFGTEELARLIKGETFATVANEDGDDVNAVGDDGNFIFSGQPLGTFTRDTDNTEDIKVDFADFFIGTDLEGAAFEGALFPYISANLDVSTDQALAPLEAPGGAAPQPMSVTSSILTEVEGEKIGVVAATTPTLAAISSPGRVGVSPSDFVDAQGNPTEAGLDALAAEIQAEVDALLAANDDLDKIILQSHFQRLEIEREIAKRLTDVDIIIGGGSNTRLFDDTDRVRAGDEAEENGVYPEFITDAAGGVTALVNTDGSYKYVGRLVIEFDEQGRIDPESYDPATSGAYATDIFDADGELRDDGVFASAAEAEGLIDPEIQAIVDAIEAQIIQTESNVFGVAEVFLNGNRSGGPTDGVRTQETNLGNLTADANLAYAEDMTGQDIQISLKNGGGIRASIGESVVPAGGSEPERSPNSALVDSEGAVIKPEGGISQTDIETTLAFNNGLVVLTLTAAEIVALLEHGVGALPEVSGRFPQIAGLEFAFDSDEPAGDRIVSAGIFDDDGTLIAPLVVDGAVVGAEQTFEVVTLGFLAAPRFNDAGEFTGGGDGYPFPNLNTDSDEGELGDPAVIARVNPRPLEQEGVRTGDADFADDGTEQDALAEYLDDNFNPENGGEAFAAEDVAPTEDERIQNLDAREGDDAVFDGFLFVAAEQGGAPVQRFDLDAEGAGSLFLEPALDDGVRQRFVVEGLSEGDGLDLTQSDIAFTRQAGPNVLAFLNGEDRDSVVFLGAEEDAVNALIPDDVIA